MTSRLISIFAGLTLAIAAPGHAQQPAKPLFAAADPIRIVIQAPLSSLIRNRDSRGTIPGTLTDPNGVSLPISLALRGISRRTSEVCEFPPLRVDFTAQPPAGSAFAGQKKLKLVTHCRNSASFQQYLLLEYAAYKMYNLLTPRSFQVRLASIDYRDATGRPVISRTGFFIEDVGDVARRNGTQEARAVERIPVTSLSSPDAARFALFEHMIGNHDWSMRAGPAGEQCCHNSKLIGGGAGGSVIPVPYDFNFAGLVDAPNANPPAELDISSVRQRFYRGYCMHNQYVGAAAREMRALRPQIIGILGQIPGLEPATQQRAGAYLEKFFADIGTDADVGNKILKRCLGANP